MVIAPLAVAAIIFFRGGVAIEMLSDPSLLIAPFNGGPE